jgi:hypothetical protein
MKRLIQLTVVLMALVMMSGTALSFNLTEHVTLAYEETGDVLVFPVVVALSNGWQTKLAVVNTSPTHGVVAKVVFRSKKFTQELLDFFIYLSPADVWTGELTYSNGGTILTSTDDSCLSSPVAFASEDQPFVVGLDPLGSLCPSDDAANIYCTVLEAWAKQYNTPGVRQSIDKERVRTDYDNEAPGLIADALNVATVNAAPLNALTGHYEILWSGVGFLAANQAEIFKDNDIDTALELRTESAIGLDSRNNLAEFEAVLAKDAIYMYYYSGGTKNTLHTLTFPTKLTQLADCTVTGFLGPFFTQNVDPSYLDPESGEPICFEYGIIYWDTEENSPIEQGGIISPVPEEDRDWLCDELNYIEPSDWQIPGSAFEEGWVMYSFGGFDTTTAPLNGIDSLSYTGAPVIPQTLFWTDQGMTLMDAAFEPGIVTYNGAVEPQYQIIEGDMQ